MEKTVSPQTLDKIIQAPPSKSVMQRVVAIAILADGKTTIKNPSFSHDSLSAIRIASALGSAVQLSYDTVGIERIDEVLESNVSCGESGLGIRMFSPVVALFGKTFRLNGEGSLLKRPISGIENALTDLGVICKTNKGYLPLDISGTLKSGKIEIDGSLSSQVLTGLLIALPKISGDSEIVVKKLKSKPYIDLTLKTMEDFGVKIENQNYERFIIPGNQSYTAKQYTVEGDWSSTAFLLAAGLISGKVKITDINLNSKQADIQVLEAIKSAGGKLTIEGNNITAEQSVMKGFDFDATDCPDLFPPLVTLAAYCKGKTKIKGVSRLIHKESNRADSLMSEFSKLGIKITLDGDLMTIEGGEINGGTVESHNDHRIAMSGAVAALGAKGDIIIKDAECVNKSYPNFYFDLFRSSLVPSRISKRRR